MKNHKKAILWDLDGTLWDACETVRDAWNEVCCVRGIDRVFSTEEYRGWCGMLLPDIAAAAFPKADRAWREDLIYELCDAECIPLAQRGGQLFPEEIPILEQLHEEYFMAVVSNCGDNYIEAFFTGNRTGQYFDDYEYAVRTGRCKGENIRLVLERNGIEQAVYIGDTILDFQAAQEACVPFIHAAYGFGQAPDAKLRAEQFAQLPELIRSVLG